MGFPWFHNGSLLFYNNGQRSSLAERCCKAQLEIEASGGGPISGADIGDGSGSGVFIATRIYTGGGSAFGSCGDDYWSIDNIDHPVSYAVRFYMMAWHGDEAASPSDFTVGLAVTLTNRNGDSVSASYSTDMGGSGSTKDMKNCLTPDDSVEIVVTVDPQCLSISFSETEHQPSAP